MLTRTSVCLSTHSMSKATATLFAMIHLYLGITHYLKLADQGCVSTSTLPPVGPTVPVGPFQRFGRHWLGFESEGYSSSIHE